MAVCRSCCSASVLCVALALGSWEAFLHWELRAATRAGPPADLPEVPTFDEAALPRERFLREFVQRREPVKIRLAEVDVWNASRLLEQCGDSELILISSATATVLSNLPWPDWFTKIVELAFVLLLRRWTTVNGEIERRINVKLSDFAAEATEPVPGGPADFSLGLPLFVQRLLPPELVAFMEIYARPRYLADIYLSHVCPEALHWHQMPRLLSPNWVHFAKGKVVDMPGLFWGKAQTQTYPMHQDIYDWDFGMITFKGKKRYAVFKPEERDKLARIEKVTHADVFEANPFAPDVVATPGLRDAKGWKGVVNPGEMLFVPGGFIHHFENYDFEDATVGMKWVYSGHQGVHACRRLSEAACAKKLGVRMPGPSEPGLTGAEVLAEAEKNFRRAG